MKSNKKYKLIKNTTIIISLAIILSYFLIKYYSSQIAPSLIEYAESKTKRIIINIINDSLTEELEKNSSQNILNISRNSNNDIELINYNTKELTKILNQISNKIEHNIYLLETGQMENFLTYSNNEDNFYHDKLIYNIPIGIATNNIFLANLGPKIPLKLKLNNNVITSINTNIKEYGINNALLELNITIEANIQIILPFTHKITTIKLSSPIAIKLLTGKIPGYYYHQPGLEYKNNENN